MAEEQAPIASMRRDVVVGIRTEAAIAVGAAAAVLGILGLAGVLPAVLAEVAVVLVGASFIAAQGNAAGRYEPALSTAERQQLRALPLAGDVTSEFVGGLAGALMGLLALLGVASTSLLAIAIIVLGAVAIMSGRSHDRVAAMLIETTDASPRVKAIAREAAGASTGALLLIGMGAVALGILALVITTNGLSLVLVASLGLGFGVLLEAASRSARTV
ncbi:MAG: hypothetical protein P8Z81_15690 [Deinococcales bacterium]|jgi:hypothetical protein